MKNKKINRHTHKNTQALNGTLKSTCLSLCASVGISLSLLLSGTAIALLTPNPTSLIDPIGYVTPFLSAFFSGFAVSKINKHAPYQISLITAAGFVLISMLISLLLPHSLTSGMQIVTRLALHTLTFALFPIGTFVGLKSSRPSHTKKRKTRK